jgi:tetratricopeptide (TPR) repeat protein
MSGNVKFRWFFIVLLGIGLFIFSGCSQRIVDPNFNMGQKFSSQGQHADAIGYFESALRNNPNNDQVWFGLGYSYYNLGRYKEAIQAFEKSRSFNPQFSGAANNIGLSHKQLGDYRSARIYFEEALRLDPNNSLARTNLASLSQTNSPQNQNSSASNSFHDLYDKGFKLSKAGNYRESLDAFKEALKINPTDAETYYAIGLNYEQLGNHQEAIAYYKEAVRFKPNDASLYSSLARMHIDLGLNNEAITYYKESLRLNPNNHNVFNDLGVAYYGLDDYLNAMASYKESIRLSPNIATSYFNMGEVLEKLAGQKEDIELLKEAYDYYYKSLERNNRLTEAKDKLRQLTLIFEAIKNKTQPSTPQPPKSKDVAIATGTGFLFGPQDYIITNYHVVKGTSEVKVKFTNGESINAEVVARDTQNDVAILKLTKSPSFQSREMKFGDSSMVRMGDKVFTIGYPHIGIMGFKPKYTEGVISAVTGIKDNPTVFQTTVPIQPGNSGGPLFNDKGEVVGLTTSSLSLLAIESMGAIPQSVNYAVKSSFVKNVIGTIPEALLSNRGIVVVPTDSNSRSDFIEAISKNVVLILGKVD